MPKSNPVGGGEASRALLSGFSNSDRRDPPHLELRSVRPAQADSVARHAHGHGAGPARLGHVAQLVVAELGHEPECPHDLPRSTLGEDDILRPRIRNGSALAVLGHHLDHDLALLDSRRRRHACDGQEPDRRQPFHGRILEEAWWGKTI